LQLLLVLHVLRPLQRPLRQYPPQHWVPDEHAVPDARQLLLQVPPAQVSPVQQGETLEQVWPALRQVEGAAQEPLVQV